MTLRAYSEFLEEDLEVVSPYRRDGKTELIYRNALPAFARILRERIADDRQNVVFCGGETGSGKSTFAVQMCRLVDKDWDMEQNYIYSLDDLKAKLDAPQSNVSLFDEGTVTLNAGNSQRTEDKQMAVLFDTMRSLKWTTFIVAPSINGINRRIRETHVSFMCLVPQRPLIPGFENRGCIQIFRKEPRDWQGDPYWRLEATTLFPKLPPRIQREYDKIKREHQMKLLREFIESEDKKGKRKRTEEEE